MGGPARQSLLLSTACAGLVACGASGTSAPPRGASGPVSPAPVSAAASDAPEVEPPHPRPAPDAASCMHGDLQALLACEDTRGPADAAAAREHARAGEAAWQSEDMSRCVQQFERALEAHGDAAEAEHWALRALRCRLEVRMDEPHRTGTPRDPARPPQELDADAVALDDAARRVACLDGDDPRAGRGLFWMARVRLQAARYAEAATLFDAVVSRRPGSDYVGHAAMLAIDALDLRSRQSAAAEHGCHERIGALLPRYRRILCEDATSARWQTECETLGRLHCALRRHVAQRMADEGLHAEGSAAFEELARDPECGSERAAELLFDAARLAELAGDDDRARRLRDELRRRFPRSPLVRP